MGRSSERMAKFDESVSRVTAITIMRGPRSPGDRVRRVTGWRTVVKSKRAMQCQLISGGWRAKLAQCPSRRDCRVEEGAPFLLASRTLRK